MFESFILGAVQGIAEWLPISSEAMIVLVKNNFFPTGMEFSQMISFAIFLHLGTVLSALVYFRHKVWNVLKNTAHYKTIELPQRQEINFIIITTLVSGVLGIFILKIIEHHESWFANENIINSIVAIFLCITAVLLFFNENKASSGGKSLTFRHSFITGIFQGFSAIPGISRSGSTIAAMGLLGIDKERALELSFLLSIPIVVGANIVLNLDTFQLFSLHHVVALVSAFLFGIVTIDVLLKLVKKIRFSYFVGIFAILLIVVGFLN